MLLGLAEDLAARKFVSENHAAKLGSLTTSGLRRVHTSVTGSLYTQMKSDFNEIEGAQSKPSPSVVLSPQSTILPCVHRGSQRKTCCDSPEMWICKKLKEDCVANEAEASKLRGMVSTQEAQDIKVCSTCSHRVATEYEAMWPARSKHDGRHSVGFLSAAYMPIGGTETFHRSLLPRLSKAVDIAGFAATAFHFGDGTKLAVPYSTGVPAAKQLAAHCNTVVVWGIQDLAKVLGPDRPYVIAVHHSDWSSAWNRNLVLNQLGLIDEVVCVNKDTFLNLLGCGKPVHYIPNAIDPDRIAPSGNQNRLREQFNIPTDSKIVLFGHRLSSEKRPRLAVDIAEHLPENWTLVIAGSGVDQAAVEEYASKCSRVRVVGACDTLADWLSLSDCFLSLSTFEGFGLSIAEALAAGVPTVSTPTGIAPGLATTLPTDATAAEWAKAIVKAKALAKPEDVLSRFSAGKMVGTWTKLLKGIR